MTSASTWRSLAELPPWQRVGHLLSQRLLLRGTATQAVEADLLTLPIHLCPNQATLPQRVHRNAPPQPRHRPLRVAPPQEHQLPLRVGLQVQAPARRAEYNLGDDHDRTRDRRGRAPAAGPGGGPAGPGPAVRPLPRPAAQDGPPSPGPPPVRSDRPLGRPPG